MKILNSKIQFSLLVIMLILVNNFVNVYAQLSADNDGGINVSPLNGAMNYSYPISNNSIDGYPVSVRINYVDNVMHRQFIEYNLYKPGEGFLQALDDTCFCHTIPNYTQYWNSYPLSKPSWIMGINGFAINMFKVTNGVIGNKGINDYLVEGFDYCNRMSVINSLSTTDVIKILKDDGSVLELRNQTQYSGSENDPSLFTGKYYEVGTNPSGYAKVEFDAVSEQLPLVNEIYQLFPDRINTMRARILRYYNGDGLEYVFREYIVPYGTKWYKDTTLNHRFNSVRCTTGIHQVPGVYPTIFYLEEINSSEKCLVKLKRDGHDYLDKDMMAYGRVPITEFANHKFTFGTKESTIEVFDKTYRLLQKPTADIIADSSTFLWNKAIGTKRKYFKFNQENGKLNTPDVSEYYIKKIIDPENRNIGFGYALDDVSAEEHFPFISDFLSESILHKKFISYYTSMFREKDYYRIRRNDSNWVDLSCDNRLRMIYDNSKVIRIKRNSANHDGSFGFLWSEIDYSKSPQALGIDNNIFNSIENIYHYERNGNSYDTIRKIEYKFSQIDTAKKYSTSVITDMVTQKVDSIKYEYTRFSTTPFQTDTSYINPLREYNIYLPTKTISTVIDSNSYLNSVVKEETTIETQYRRSDSLGGFSKISFYPVSNKTILKNYNNSAINADEPSCQIQYKEMKYAFDTLNYFNNNAHYAQLVKSDTTFVYKPNSTDGNYTVHLKQVNNYKSYNLQEVSAITERDVYDANATSLNIDDAYINGVSVAQVPQVRQYWRYDRKVYPIITGVPTSNYVFNDENKILGGKIMVYNDELNPANGRRGSLIRDSIIGSDNSRLLNAEYFYHPNSKLLIETKSANGATNKQYYKYSEVTNGSGVGFDKVPGKVLRNNNAIDLYDFQKIEYNYETPAVTESQVRYIDSNNTPQIRYLRNYFKKTYFGNNTGIIDNNGWLSAFDYDANGRLKTTWLPYDFPTCGIKLRDYNDSHIPLFDKKTKITEIIDTVFRNTKSVKRNDSLIVRYDASKTCIGTDIYDSNVLDSNINIQRRIKYITQMDYRAGVNSPFVRGEIINKAYLRFYMPGCNSNEQIMLKLRIDKFGYEKILLIGAGEYGNNIPALSMPKSAESKYVRFDLSDIIKDFAAMKRGDNARIEIEVMNEHAKLDILQFSEDSRTVIEIYKGDATNSCTGLDDFTTSTIYSEKPGDRSLTTLKKIDDPMHQVNSNGGNTSIINLKSMQGRYTASMSTYGYENRNLKNVNYINVNNNNPLDTASFEKYTIYNQYTGFSKLLSTTDDFGVGAKNIYGSKGDVIQVDKTFNDDDIQTNKISKAIIGPARVEELINFKPQQLWQVSCLTNANGIVTMELFDEYGRLRATINNAKGANRLVTKYEYDDRTGNLLEVTKPDNSNTKYSYDEFNRVIYKNDNIAGISQYRYDNNGRLRFTMNEGQDSNSKFTFLQYDDLGRSTIVGEAKDIDFWRARRNTLNINGYPYNTNTINNKIYEEYEVGKNDMKTFGIVQVPVKTPEFNYKGSYIAKDIAVIQNSSKSDLLDFENIGTHAHFVRVANFYDEFPATKLTIIHIF